MAYNKTLKIDQLFVREIIFKDFGNRPISSQQLLVTRGDGVIYFSNAPDTSSLGAYNLFTIDNKFTYTATNPINTFYFLSGQGIELKNLSTAVNSLQITNTGPQNLYVYDNGGSNLSFSSLTTLPGIGRTLFFAGVDDIRVSLSANTVKIGGGVYNSSLSSFIELQSTTQVLIDYVSTQIVAVSTLLSTLDLFLIITNFSSIYYQLSTYSDTVYNVSTFIYETFQDDLTYGSHSRLLVSSIATSNISSVNTTTSNLYTSSVYIGNNQLFDTPSASNATPDCVVFISDLAYSTTTDYFHIQDSLTSVDIALGKKQLLAVSTVVSTINSTLTFVTSAKIAEMGIITQLDGQSSFRAITQQVESKQYYTMNTIELQQFSTYTLTNIIYADELCATSSLQIMAPEGVFAGNTYVSSITTNTAATSSLCVSTILGDSSPIFTFDKIHNRVGLNLGQLQPRATFDVSGVVFANNFVTPSDRLLKSNIQELHSLPYLSSYSYSFNGDNDIGVLADEVERVAPSCVYHRPDGFKAVAYQKLVPVLLSYIKDLDARLKRIESIF